MRNPFTMWQFWALAVLGAVMLTVGIWGMTRSNASVTTPGITRPLHVVIELDPNDNGTALFHCHFHTTSGNGNRTFIFTHCKRGLR